MRELEKESGEREGGQLERHMGERGRLRPEGEGL
jgi:hypothetical protein